MQADDVVPGGGFVHYRLHPDPLIVESPFGRQMGCAIHSLVIEDDASPLHAMSCGIPRRALTGIWFACECHQDQGLEPSTHHEAIAFVIQPEGIVGLRVYPGIIGTLHYNRCTCTGNGRRICGAGQLA